MRFMRVGVLVLSAVGLIGGCSSSAGLEAADREDPPVSRDAAAEVESAEPEVSPDEAMADWIDRNQQAVFNLLTAQQRLKGETKNPTYTGDRNLQSIQIDGIVDEILRAVAACEQLDPVPDAARADKFKSALKNIDAGANIMRGAYAGGDVDIYTSAVGTLEDGARQLKEAFDGL